MSDENTNQTEAEVIGRLARQGVVCDIKTIVDPRDNTEAIVAVTSHADGHVSVREVDEHFDMYRAKPLYRRGVACVHRLESLIEHANRFKSADSAIFAHEAGARINIPYDYHPAGPDPTKAGWGRHEAVYEAKASREWKRWIERGQQKMDQVDFAEFIEDNVADVMEVPDFLKGGDAQTDADKELLALVQKIEGRPCGPAKLMELSRGLKVFSQEEAAVEVKLDSGEARVVMSEKHLGADKKPLSIPSMFLVSIPVFIGGPLWRVPIRLRYRKHGGSIVWFIQPYGEDRIRRVAFEEDCLRVSAETELPLFWGDHE